MMISDKQKAKIIQFRGLGYTQKEIADKVGLTLAQVNYNLQEINDQAKKEGDNNVYMKLLSNGFLPEMIDTIQKASKIGVN
ncbi:hypothetical protein ACFLRF_03420 [Candidatus Altiarchaeota archaeon]